MARPKRYRWACPLCGAGRLLGKAPRHDATDAHCWPCSKETGKLVRLECPTLARVRAGRQAVQKKKALRLKEKAEAIFMVEGHDIRKAVRRVYKVALKVDPELPRRQPRLIVKQKTWGSMGWAWYQLHKICIFRTPLRYKDAQRSWKATLDTIIHEVAHLMAWHRIDYKTLAEEGHHGITFKGALADLRIACTEAGILEGDDA